MDIYILVVNYWYQDTGIHNQMMDIAIEWWLSIVWYTESCIYQIIRRWIPMH